MPASKRKPDPLTPLKQAVRITTRSMAGDRKLDVTFTGEVPGFDGKTARLPALSPPHPPHHKNKLSHRPRTASLSVRGRTTLHDEVPAIPLTKSPSGVRRRKNGLGKSAKYSSVPSVSRQRRFSAVHGSDIRYSKAELPSKQS
jgi:hypothetical protein